MKLRNKLAAVMAASMVVTAVPVVTMADSTNNLSIYNYKIKDTTVGFKTTDKVLVAGTSTTQSSVKVAYTSAQDSNLNGTATFAINANLPKLEINPEYSYTGVNQTAFLHLTKDSEFKPEAYLAYVDAASVATGTTSLYVDKDGKIQNANNATWNNQKADDIVKAGLTLSVGAGATVKITVMDITETKFNDREYKSTLRLDFSGNFNKGTAYAIPFLAKVGGDKEVLAYLDGHDSFVSTKTFTLTGVLSDKKLVATSGSNTITIDNIEKIGEIRLDENQIQSLGNAENKWIKVKLDSSADLQFNLSKTKENLKAVGKRGFYGKTDATVKNGGIEVAYGKTTRTTRDRSTDVDDDNQVLLIKLPDWTDVTAYGQVVLDGIYVEPQDKTAATGDVNVTLSEDLTRGTGRASDNKASTDLVASTRLKVATIADYGVTIESTPIDVKAGRSGVVNEKKATFTLKESVKDSLVDTRKIEFNLENGYIFGPADVDYTANNTTNGYSTSSYAEKAKARFKELVADQTIKFEEKAEKDGDKKGFDLDSLSLTIDANGYVTGFSGRYDRLKNDEDDKIKVTMPVAAPVMAKGEIKVKAGNLFTRSYEKDVEAVIANIKEPINVEVENAKLKVGKQEQTAGKVTIKETDKGMIERGWLFLSAEDLQAGLTFDELPTIKVTSADDKALKVENAQISRDKKVVAFEVTRTSKEASTIEVSNIKFTADRTVPEANYDLQIWGNALTDENVLDVLSTYSTNVLNSNTYRNQYTDMYVVKDFISMTTKNTQDLNAAGLKAATAKFVIGENKFTVNGETVSMDAASYVNSENFTMVPVRYVAQAFGIEGNAIQYDKKTSTATIVAGTKVISVTANKPVIVVNGTAMPMATKAVVKDNRMFVPLAYIASALDIQKSWDASTKTATFTNQTEEAK